MTNQNVYANLNVFPIQKKAFIVTFDKDCATFSAQLEYSTNIKDLELQVLLHGYTILNNSKNSVEDYIIIYDLKRI